MCSLFHSRWIFLLLLLLISCQQKPPPAGEQYEKLWHVFLPVYHWTGLQVHISDLDNDGIPEFVHLITKVGTPSFIIYTAHWELISQNRLPAGYRLKQAFDLDGDGIKELIFERRNKDDDHLWEVFRWKEETWQEFLIHSRDSRCTNKDWDFCFVPFERYDVTVDGYPEVIGVMNTGYGGYPRGVGAYNLVKKCFAAKFDMGAAPSFEHHLPVLINIDQDEQPEVLLCTEALKNGSVANGLDDYHSYLLAIDLKSWQLDYKEVLGDKHIKSCLQQFVSASGDTLFVINAYSDEVNGENSLRIYDQQLNLITSRKVNLRLNPKFFLSDIDRDGKKDIVVSSRDKKILVFNQDLELIREKTFPFYIRDIANACDYDRDGRDEFFVRFLNGNVLMVNDALEPFAYLKKADRIKIFEDGISEHKQFAVWSASGFTVNQLQFSWERFRQRFPWYIYYLMLILITIFSVLIIIRLVRAIRFHRLLNRYVAFNQKKGIVIFNRKGRILLINQYFQEQVTSRPLETIEQMSEELQRQPGWEEVGNFLLNSWKNRSALPDSTDHSLASADRHLKLRLTKIRRGRTLQAYLFEIENISQIIFAERARSRVAIMRSIAHDIKQPLTNVMLTMDKVKFRYQDLQVPCYDEFIQYADLVKSETGRVSEIIRSLLEFADLEKPHKTLGNLQEVLDKLTIEYVQLLPSDVRLTTHIEGNLPEFYFDPRQVERALRNVVNNAIAAMPDGGEITISAELAPKLSSAKQDWIRVRVEDTGVGIPEEHLMKVFEPYFTTRATGSGLGLSIVQEIMEKHGGRVQIFSKVGEGTAVELLFPILTQPEADDV